MQIRSRILLVLVSNLLMVLGLLVFAKGFFPHKAFLPGLAVWNENDDASSIARPFDRVLFMVVDALRRSVLKVQ